jgi:heat shock protein HtpX
MFGINQIKTVALLGLLSGILVLAGYYLVGNEQGLYLGLALAALTSFSSWFYSGKAALAAYRAQPLRREQAPSLYDSVARLSERAGISMPAIFIVPTESPNAFATGRDPEHSTVAVTEGIINLLTPDELD